MFEDKLKLLESLEHAGVESRRRGIVFAWTSLAIAILGTTSLIVYSDHTVRSLRAQRTSEEAAVAALRAERAVLEADLAKSRRLYAGLKNEVEPPGAEQAPQLSPASVDREAILRELHGKRREALLMAFRFYDQRVPFVWGGKNPSDGFDTSGFVAYILAQVGVVDHPERLWSGLLRQTFSVKVRGASQLLPGDLVFEENRACWFILNERFTIGMVPGGVMLGEPDNFSSKIIGYGRVPYDPVPEAAR